MPCDQVILNRVEIGTMNKILLERALRTLGATGLNIRGAGLGTFYLDGQFYEISNGTMQSRDTNVGAVADRVKRHYSREVVRYSAQKQGWTLKEVRPFVYEVQK